MMPRAKKSYGQHWLVDETVVRKIIDAAHIEAGETVLEIGPGTGVLTQALVDAGARVTAIEADTSLIPALRERFGNTIELIHGDILSWSLPPAQAEACGYRYQLIANIPYNITSDVLRRFLTREPRPTRMVLMVQREVADRIVAQPPHMSLLSVVCQLYAACSLVARVPAGAFRPIPNVDSAVVKLDPFAPGRDQEAVIRLAKRGYSSRRKQLHRNLSAIADAQTVKDALARQGLSPTARAQELSVDNWIELTHMLLQK